MDQVSIADGVCASAESLDDLARRIEQAVAKGEAQMAASDEHFIEAGRLMLEAKKRVQAGALGPDIRWEAWARKNINLSDSWRRQLMQIAKAEDPHAELKRWREIRRDVAQKHRAKSTPSALEAERKELIEFAREAPIELVQPVLRTARRIQHKAELGTLPKPPKIERHGKASEKPADAENDDEAMSAGDEQRTIH